MILRPSYIEALAPFIDQLLVKILAGVRRCGKSTIFEMLAGELRRRGVPEECIVQKRYTEMDIPSDISAKDMYDELRAQIRGKGRCYLLLDEIQRPEISRLEVQELPEGERKDRDGHIPAGEIGGDLTGHQFGVGAGDIDICIRAFQ